VPNLALTSCAEPGCDELVAVGRCARHRRAHDRARGSSTARGYTQRWRTLRRYFLRARCQSCGDHPTATCPHCGGTGFANRLCRECLAGGQLVLATEVDHVLPHQDWPELRLDVRDLQALCEAHHRRKTAAETSGRSLSPFQQAQRARVLALLGDEAVDTPDANPKLLGGHVAVTLSTTTDPPTPSDSRLTPNSPRTYRTISAPKLLTKSYNWRVFIGGGCRVKSLAKKDTTTTRRPPSKIREIPARISQCVHNVTPVISARYRRSPALQRLQNRPKTGQL